MDNYETGRADRRAFRASGQYKQLAQDLPGCIAMKLFLPPVPQDMMQIARPLPQPWGEWVRGWDDELVEGRCDA